MGGSDGKALAVQLDPAATVAVLSSPAPRDGSASSSSFMLARRPQRGLRAEVCRLLGLAAPFSVSLLARKLHALTDMAVLGQVGTHELAASSLAYIWMSLADLPMQASIAQLTTLCSGAYGAGNYELVGTWLQIALLFIAISSVPILFSRLLTEDILLLCGFDADLAASAGVYSKWVQFSAVFSAVYSALREYLASQGVANPTMSIDVIFVFINWGLNYLFVFSAGLGLRGSALATTVTRFLLCVAFWAYCFCYRRYHSRTWHWQWHEALVWARWRTFLSLAAPAAVGSLAESLQLEVLSVMAGNMGSVTIAAHSLLMTLLGPFFCLADGLAMATGIRVAHCLGAGEALRARGISHLATAMAGVAGIVLGVLLIWLGPLVDRLLTADESVRAQMQALRLLVALVVATLMTFSVIYTVLCKQGRTSLPSLILPLLCWGVGCPASWYLAQPLHLGLLGLWLGLLMGYLLVLAALLVLMLRSDWHGIADGSQRCAEAACSELDVAMAAGLSDAPPQRTVAVVNDDAA